MKNFLFSPFIILFSSMHLICSFSNAQNVLQRKAYIVNDKILLPMVEDKIALIQYDFINSQGERIDSFNYVLPTGVSSFLNREIPFCIIGDRLVAVSISDENNRVWTGPDFVAIKLEYLRRKYPKELNPILLAYKKTYHYHEDLLWISGHPIKAELINIYDTVSLSVDIEFDGKDILYLAINSNNGFRLYSVYFEKLPLFNDSSLSFDKHRLRFNQVLSAPKLEASSFNLAYLNNDLLIIDNNQNVFKVREDKITTVVEGKTATKTSRLDSFIIVDKDNQALYLSSKELLKNHKGTMLDFLRLCTKVPIE